MQQSETESDGEFMEPEVESEKNKIKVFDRFTIILQIFAKRAKTKISKLQIELCFLEYLKSKLVRDGGTTFSSMYNIFRGDLMSAEEIKLEVVSAKSKVARGTATGEGETQLEL